MNFGNILVILWDFSRKTYLCLSENKIKNINENIIVTIN